MARPSIHAIFGFVLTEGNIGAEFTTNMLMGAIDIVQSCDMNVFAIIADGSSVNIKSFKSLLGEPHPSVSLHTSYAPGAAPPAQSQ